MKILINYDFSTGNEISYQQCLNILASTNCDIPFETHCLQIFSFDNLLTNIKDIVVRKKNGDYISMAGIMENCGKYTNKEIRHSHNILKILLAGGFKWQNDDNCKECDYTLDEEINKLLTNILTISHQNI